VRILSGKVLKFMGSLVCIAALGACAGTGDRLAADAVRVLTADQLTNCAHAGSVHVSVVDRLSRLQQVDGGVQQELETLARSSALPLGGNAIVPVTGIDKGSQSFAVYHCP
jgi:hypothetical protein